MHGGYLSEYAALLDAIDAAHASGKSGEPSQVLTRARDGTETVIWTYGSDPFPWAPPWSAAMQRRFWDREAGAAASPP